MDYGKIALSKVEQLVPENLQNISSELTIISNQIDLSTIDIQTGTYVQSKVSDDSVVELKIEGATQIIKTNPDLDISPSNIAVITNAKNFDLFSCGQNILDMINFTSHPERIKGVFTNGIITLDNSTNTSKRAEYRNTVHLQNGITYTLSTIINIISGYLNGIFVVYKDTYNIAYTIYNLKTSASILKTFTFTLGSGLYDIIIVTESNSLQKLTIEKLQLEFGTVTVPKYSPYQGLNKLTITQELPKLPNGVADTIEYIGNNKAKYIKKVKIATVNVTGDIVDAKINGQYISNVTPTGNFIGNTFTMPNGASSAILQYELATPIETIIDLPDLKTYKGITNIYTTANPQVSLTANFKSKLANAYSLIMLEISKIKQAIIALGGTV
jgi:hypothetical protein